MKQKALMSWSSGKDSAFTLHRLMNDDNYEVVGLLTTLARDYDRVSMHGVRRALLEAQARSTGLPLHIVWISAGGSNDDYEQQMRAVLEEQKAQGVTAVAIGDIFLEDLRRYREEKLAQLDMNAVFPIWGEDTAELSRRFIDSGFKSVITCVDSECMPGEFAGRTYDHNLLSELPAGVDPCGENGEFHSFAFDGPIFRSPISFTKGEVVMRENRFYFCDIIPPG